MPAYFGAQKLSEFYFGGNKIASAYFGSNLVYASAPAIRYVQFGAVGNATAKMYVTATFNGQTTSWNNGTSTAYQQVPVGSTIEYSAVCPDYYRLGSCVGGNVDNFTSASTVSYGKTITGTCTVKDTSGWVSTNNTHTNTFTARGNLKWKNNITGAYNGIQQGWPSLQITGWTGTQPSSTMTGGIGTNYGATATNKAKNLTGNRAWVNITDWQSESLKAPVNCSSWKMSGSMFVGAVHSAGGSVFTSTAERALTAGVYLAGATGAQPGTATFGGWFPQTSNGTKTQTFTVNATAAKYGTNTNLGSYSFGAAAQNYTSVGTGSGSTYSWAYNRITAMSGVWYASGILP